MHVSEMECPCGANMIWGGSHDTEDEGFLGMVHNLSCSRRGCENHMLFWEVLKE